MGQMKSLLLFFYFLLRCLLNGVETSPNCSGAFLGLSDCLDFVLEGSMVYPNLGGPCCLEIGSVVKQSSTCLCEAAVGATRLGIDLNVTRALVLISVCKVVYVPVAPCDIASPVPLAPWHASSPASPETTPAPSPAPNLESKNAPTFPPNQSPAPSLPVSASPGQSPFVHNILSPHSESSESASGQKMCAINSSLIFTLFVIACLYSLIVF